MRKKKTIFVRSGRKRDGENEGRKNAAAGLVISLIIRADGTPFFFPSFLPDDVDRPDTNLSASLGNLNSKSLQKKKNNYIQNFIRVVQS